MQTLAIDLETYSDIDLEKSGVYAYAASPGFRVLLFGYAFDDEPVRVIDLSVCSELPEDIVNALSDSNVLKTAYNANFERVCLSAVLKHRMPPEQWECTMVRALEAGLPRSLAAAGEALGLPAAERKDAEGKRLIKLFCTPGEDMLLTPKEAAPELWERFIEYNRQDVEAERAVREKLPPIDRTEQKLWELDQRINDLGVLVDMQFVKNAAKAYENVCADIFTEAKQITGLENPKSRTQMLGYLNESNGTARTSLKKADFASVYDECQTEEARRALEIYMQLTKTSNAKYEAMLNAACPDGRLRGITAFYGGARTGRWAGRLLQPQNLPRNSLEDLDTPRSLIKEDCADALELLYDDSAAILSQLIRTALIPKEDCRFVVSDFSAIEARVLAYLAGEKWRLEVFRIGGKIYEESASKMFGVPVEKISKGNPEYSLRQKGKIAELALGYGGGTGALIQMGALKMGIDEEELPFIVSGWRASNTKITDFWRIVEISSIAALETGGERRVKAGDSYLCFKLEQNSLTLTLPSGRKLYYREPMLCMNKFGKPAWSYMGVNQKTRKWERIETYGGKLTENIIQATARDCLAFSMLELTARGLSIVFHVHDEVIIECPLGISSAEEVARIMSISPPWAEGLPLSAEAYECGYYKKD